MTEAPPEPPAHSRRRPTALLALGALLLFAGVAGALAWEGSGPGQPDKIAAEASRAGA